MYKVDFFKSKNKYYFYTIIKLKSNYNDSEQNTRVRERDLLYRNLMFCQTLSPMAKGLFHRAVFQSGVATLTDFSENPMVAAKVV